MRKIFIILFLSLFASLMQAQITIRGNVFGGARQADVGGSTFVNIGGEKTTCDIIITAVYGGNDISGTIGASDTVPKALLHAAECGLTTRTGEGDNKDKNLKGYNAFVRVNPMKKEAGEQSNHIFIGQLFGGGYGDYDYTLIEAKEDDGSDENEDENENVGKYKVERDGNVIAEAVDNLPELGKTYLEICGGTFGYVYGGGNNVTVTDATDIYIHNESDIAKVSTNVSSDNAADVLVKSTDLSDIMGINTAYYDNSYHFSRVLVAITRQRWPYSLPGTYRRVASKTSTAVETKVL